MNLLAVYIYNANDKVLIIDLLLINEVLLITDLLILDFLEIGSD